jgi:hypothetical protein
MLLKKQREEVEKKESNFNPDEMWNVETPTRRKIETMRIHAANGEFRKNLDVQTD